MPLAARGGGGGTGSPGRRLLRLARLAARSNLLTNRVHQSAGGPCSCLNPQGVLVFQALTMMETPEWLVDFCGGGTWKVCLHAYHHSSSALSPPVRYGHDCCIILVQSSEVLGLYLGEYTPCFEEV